MPTSAKRAARPPLDAGVLNSLIGFNLRIAQLAVYDDFLRRAPVPGLTPGQLAILILIERNREITQQRLSDGIGVEKSTLVVRLHRLADRGLIERVRSTADRRENGLRLTSRGQATLKRMLAFVARHEKLISEQLSDAERKQLIALLRKIGRAPNPRRSRLQSDPSAKSSRVPELR